MQDSPTTTTATTTILKEGSSATSVNGNHQHHHKTNRNRITNNNHHRHHSTDPRHDWYTIFLDVEKSKFFDPQYAVLEGDVWRDVHVELPPPPPTEGIPTTTNNCNNNGNSSDHGDNTDTAATSTNPTMRTMTRTNDDDDDPSNRFTPKKTKTLILKRHERCFVIVRKESTSVLFDTLVPKTMAHERHKVKPRTTGWLRHEFYGLQAGIRLPLQELAVPQSQGSRSTCVVTNKRGIKCLDFPGEFIGLFDQETLHTMASANEDNDRTKNNDDGISGRRLTQIQSCPTPHYSADNDEILTIQQSELQERLTRHKHFATWLVNTFGKDMLNRGSVLDVAGGNGKLSNALLKMGIHSCTIIDPQPLCRERTEDGLTIIPKPLMGDGRDLTDPGSPYSEKIRQCSIIVGLHPDEATEAAMDLAMRLGKPFAISPCCVMTRLFPNRKGRMGEPVRTVHQLCRYLMDKQAGMKVDYLPFMGRNKVLYWKGPDFDTPITCQPIHAGDATTRGQ